MRDVATCGHCGASFEPAPAEAGALVNCPKCGRVVDVPGLRDPLWAAARLLVLAAAIGAGWLVGGGDPWLGAGAAVAVLAAAWLLSRAL